MTILTFVRHGETEWNKEKRRQGQTDTPLNDTGVMQAEALARRFSRDSFDAIYASDLSRAWATAERIASKLGLPVFPDTRLRERSHGRLEGTTSSERKALWGPDWEAMDHGDESNEAVRLRGLQFIEEIKLKHPGGRVMAVSHGGLIGQTVRGLMNDSAMASLDNTSVSVLRHFEGHWNCELFNCTRHLA